MELNSRNGEYRFYCTNPDIPKNKLAFEWQIVGENGSSYKNRYKKSAHPQHIKYLKINEKLLLVIFKKMTVFK